MKRGFTLVEILVLLAIVSVLVAVMIPLHRGIRARGAATVSSSNLHSLVTANWGYAADHGGYFCPAQSRNNLVRWHGARSSASGEFDPAKGFLSPYLGESRRVNQCPLFEDFLTDGQSFEDGTGGYGYNATYIGGTPEDMFQPIKMTRILRPGRTVMFASTAFAREDGAQEYPFAEPYQWVDPNWNLAGPLQPSVHFRFRGKALIAWCDGHVTLEEMEDEEGPNYYGGSNAESMIGWFGPKEGNGYWNPFYKGR